MLHEFVSTNSFDVDPCETTSNRTVTNRICRSVENTRFRVAAVQCTLLTFALGDFPTSDDADNRVVRVLGKVICLGNCSERGKSCV